MISVSLPAKINPSSENSGHLPPQQRFTAEVHFPLPECSLQVINVYENTSEELLELLENFCDLFRNARLVAWPSTESSHHSNGQSGVSRF